MVKNQSYNWQRHIAVLGMLIATFTLCVGCSLLPDEQGALKPPLVKPAQAVARTVEVKIGSIVRQISGSARFVPTQISYHPFGGNGGKVKSVEVRAGNIVKKGDVLVTLDNGDIDFQLLQKELEVERKKLSLEDAFTSGDERKIRIAQLDYKLATMYFDKTKEQVVNANLRARVDGIVTFVAELKPGDMVEAGRVLVAIADPTGIRISFDAGGNQVMKDIVIGLEAEIEVDGKSYKGKVTQTPSSAPLTEDVRLREEYAKIIYIEMEDLPPNATLGTMVDIKIVAARREKVTVLPKSGIRNYFGRTYVQVLDGERRREIDVETGLENSTEIEVVKGLEIGMKVILQ